jgi:glycosyltransferase involved in cell wall biosynthesis
MSAPIALVTGSLPPEVCGVGDYTHRLYEELRKVAPVELVHAPIRKAVEPALFRVFKDRELVHLEYPTEGWGKSVLPSLLAIAPRHCKLIITLHEWSRMNPLRRASIRPLVAKADGFVFVSEGEREAFLRTAPPAARSKPTWVIPIGVNLSVPHHEECAILEFRNAQTQGGRFDLLLTHFGFIHESKQPFTMLEAVKELQEKGRRPLLTFVGDFQKDKVAQREEFLSEIKAEALESCVKLRGFVQDEEEAALYMASCDANISLFSDGLTPRRGSFWYAAQHGCHLITTTPQSWREFGALGEVLQPPHVQFVEPECRGADLARVLESLPEYKPRRFSAVPVPTWSEIAQKHECVYRELLG